MIIIKNKYWDYRHTGEIEIDGLLKGSLKLKYGFADMLKGGVVMDVTTIEQAKIAEKCGAVSVMVLDKLPADIRKAGGVARAASIEIIKDIIDTISIPVMAKCRIGHTYEAKVLEAARVDMIDESEVLTPADVSRHIWKWGYKTPFVCGAKDLGEALRRYEEGCAMIRTKGEPGTGNIQEAVCHFQTLNNQMQIAIGCYEKNDGQELMKFARSINVSLDTLIEACELKRIPIVNFSAGGIVTPADAAQMMLMGADGVFVGSGIFKSEDPENRAKAIIQAVTHFTDPEKVLDAQLMIDEKKSMFGMEISNLELRMQDRGANI